MRENSFVSVTRFFLQCGKKTQYLIPGNDTKDGKMDLLEFSVWPNAVFRSKGNFD